MKISVVTIVKDNADGLKSTLNSLIAQKYTEWESIIVVAESRDNSLEVANSFDNQARVSVHEQKGFGIYEAMNQGLQNASGEYTVFMNSGDRFYDDDVLETFYLSHSKKPNFGVYVGGYSFNSKVDDTLVKYLLKFGEISPFRFSLCRRACHQAMYFNTDVLMKEGGYSLEYRFCSDFDAALRVSKRMGVQGIPKVLAIIERGGVAESNISKVIKEKYKIRQVEFPGIIARAINMVYTFLLEIKVTFFRSKK